MDVVAVVPELESSMPVTPTRYKMPGSIHEALAERNLMEAYRARPDCQQNDYIGSLCVTRAKREETKEKRLDQMLNELEGGDRYMNLVWKKPYTLPLTQIGKSLLL
jgi:hypothetical protein